MNNKLAIFLCLFTALMYLSNDIYLPSIDNIAIYYNMAPAVLVLSITAWLIGALSAQIIFVFIKPTINNLTVLLMMSTFLLLNLFVFFNTNLTLFFLARILTGAICGCSIIITYAFIYQHFQSTKTVAYFSLLNLLIVFSIVLGPLIGGIILHIFPFQYIFLFLAVLTGICILYLKLTLVFTQAETDAQPKKGKWQLLKQLLKNYRYFAYTIVNSLFFSSIILWLSTGAIIFSHNDYTFPITQIALCICFLLGNFLGIRYCKLIQNKRSDYLIHAILFSFAAIGLLVPMTTIAHLCLFGIILFIIGHVFPFYQKHAIDLAQKTDIWLGITMYAIITGVIATLSSIAASFFIAMSEQALFKALFFTIILAVSIKIYLNIKTDDDKVGC